MANLEGQKFNRLLVVNLLERRDKNGARLWNCICDCGNTVVVSTDRLRSGWTKSCGCFQRDTVIENNKARAHYQDVNNARLYRIWKGMIARTIYPSQDSYENYGGKGITVCKEWINDYLMFESWALNNGYSDELSIDRIDGNKNYSPSNCRWADRTTQNNNQKSNINLSIGDLTMSIAQWAKFLGVPKSRLYWRRRRGYNTENILKEYYIGKGE